MRAIKDLILSPFLLFLILYATTITAQNSSFDKPINKEPIRLIIPPKDTVKTNIEPSNDEQLINDYNFDYGGTILIDLPGGNEDAFPNDKNVDTDINTTNTSNTTKPPSTNTTQPGVAVRTYTSEEIDRLIHPEKELNREQNFHNFIQSRKLIEPEMVSLKSFSLNQIPSYNDESYRIKLEILHSEIPLTYNEYVKIFIDMYLIEKRDQVKQMLARKELYLPACEAALDRHDLPMYLKYLPVILSALTPHAKSSSGASGLWQLPYETARLYGLESNDYIDERRDPRLSSEVAAKHLINLWNKYHDWHLTIAAFCGGEGAVNKAIRRSGGQKDYWVIAEYLPEEIQAYVPLFIAAVYTMTYYPDHNIHQFNAPYNFYLTDTVSIKRGFDLSSVAKFVDMKLEEVQFLNPAIKRDTIPPSKRGYPLVLPISKVGWAQSYERNLNAINEETILDSNKKLTLPPDNIWTKPTDEYGVISSTNRTNVYNKTTQNSSISTYVVLKYPLKPGDILGTIAQKFDCTIADLRQWNDIEDESRMKIGQELLIMVPKEHEMLYKNIIVKEN
ncbi:MAG: transglycosylase SLT domain-containing protein [Chitinophagales bacterium]